MSDKTYEEFVTAVFDGVEFDEQAEQDDLLRSAERFELVRRCWVAGEAYEPSRELEATVLAYFKANAERSFSSPVGLEVARSLELLSTFCLEKSRAVHRRLRGSIDVASQYESAAERAYNQLPQQWKW